MQTIIWWIRRDLRIDHNPALNAALKEANQLIPLFIIDPNIYQKKASPRQRFLMAGLRQLNADLQNRGSQLIICKGKPLEILTECFKSHHVSAIYAEEDITPYAIQRDQEIQNVLPLKLVSGLLLQHPELVRKKDNTPYRTFTPFKKSFLTLPFTGVPGKGPNILPPAPAMNTEVIPQDNAPEGFPPGETEAGKRLNNFINHLIQNYHHQRNFMSLQGTSQLSPYFRFGMLSIHKAYHQAMIVQQDTKTDVAREGIQTWIGELIWRDFFNYILYHFPYVKNTAYYENKRNIPWRNAPEDLQRWQNGETGYPLVDACMRQLLGLNWMQNRGRMITASFLVKDLLINWQEGEKWFMKNLVDGDLAANNGGWQWSAGVGTDAAPYFRIFNPVRQSERYDPQGDFIRKWVAELQKVPNKFIHTPWLMPKEIQNQTNCIIEQDYPAPIVDHQFAKERTLNAYRNSS